MPTVLYIFTKDLKKLRLDSIKYGKVALAIAAVDLKLDCIEAVCRRIEITVLLYEVCIER